MFIKSHTSYLFKQEDSYTFWILKTNVLIDNNVIRIIELNEISESISSDKRIKRIDSIIENESKFLLYFDGNSSVEDRICSIFDVLE